MSDTACAPISFSEYRAGSAVELLRDHRELRGTLEDIQPADDGLICVTVAGLRRLVPEELESELQPLRGRFVSILRLDGYDVKEVPRRMRT